MKPERIQRKRTKGWKLPENTVVVTRGTKFGNHFIVSPKAKPGSRSGAFYTCVPTVHDAVECFRLYCYFPLSSGFRQMVKKELRGKNLACFCPVKCPACNGSGWFVMTSPIKPSLFGGIEGVVDVKVTRCADCDGTGRHPCHADVLLKIANP